MNKLRIGVLGVGNMGSNHLRVLSSMRECELLGCFDVDSNQSRNRAQQYGIESFSSPKELFENVDVAHIVVPSFLHVQYAVEAANAGCHVLVEKPIALFESDARKIIDACRDNSVRLCVGHVERYNPVVQTLREILPLEEIIAMNFHRMSPFDPRVSDASVVQDLMIHDIDVLNAIMHGVPVADITSQGACVYTDKLDYAQAQAVFENGVVANLSASRITESKIRIAEIHTKKCYIKMDFIRKSIEISRKTKYSLDVGYSVQYRQENIVESVMVPLKEPLRTEFEHFYGCIESGEPIETSGEMGLAALCLSKIIEDNAVICRS